MPDPMMQPTETAVGPLFEKPRPARPHLPVSFCRGCGKPIVSAETVEGKKIPLDPKPAVYALSRSTHGRILAERCLASEGTLGAFVSHFATCPKANDFSASSRKE